MLVLALLATDCSKCHANNGKGIFQKVHESHKGKVPCNSCHLTNQNSVVLRQLSSGETISVSKDDFELYSELLSTDEGSASKLHLSKGLTCGSCHKESAPQEGSTVDNDRCLSCHGSYEELAKKTQKAEKSDNPHSSHQGKLECSRCHAGHSKTKSYCLECHSNFNQKMPENWLITFSRS